MFDRNGATIRVERMNLAGPRLIIESPQQLAHDFFTMDASSVGPDAYDAQVGRGDPNRITVENVVAINTTMRARSPHSVWAPLTSAKDPLPWLVAMPQDTDLFGLDDLAWAAIRLDLDQALAAMIGPYRNLSVATKVLHLKRPSLFPVLDSLVIEQIGGLGRPRIELLGHIRTVGLANLEALSSIRDDLHLEGIDRSRVRILDALLWASHPAAGLARELGAYEHHFGPRQSPELP